MSKQKILVRTYPNTKNSFVFDGWNVSNSPSGVEIFLPKKNRTVALSFNSNGIEISYWKGTATELQERLETVVLRG